MVALNSIFALISSPLSQYSGARKSNSQLRQLGWCEAPHLSATAEPPGVLGCHNRSLGRDGLAPSAHRKSAGGLLPSDHVKIVADAPAIVVGFTSDLPPSLLPHHCRCVAADLPGNPFLPDGPPTTRFLDFDSLYANVAKFMKANAITGRVFCSWELEPFLVFHVPGVKVFAGTRAQSFYSPETIEHYRTIQLTRSRDRESVFRTLGLLDTYQVDVVVLRREPIYLPLELALTFSADWANIYRDPWATVMIRSSSEMCRSLLKHGSLASLEYPDPKARIVAEAYLAQFVKGWLPEDAVDGLKGLVADHPVPDVYWLLGYRGTGRTRCLAPDIRDYFRSEVERLSSMDHMTAEGAHTILGSLLTLSTFLEMDERSCEGQESSDKYGEIRQRSAELKDNLQKRYWGRVYERM